MNPYAEPLAWALVNFVWQGAALALMAFLVIRWIRPSAGVRYATGVVTLALMLAAPVVTFALLARAGNATAVAPAPASQVAEPPAADTGSTPTDPSTSTAPQFAASGLVLAVWLSGVAVFSLRLLGGWVVARRMVTRAVRPVAPEIAVLARRVAARLALDRVVRILESSSVSVPVMVGWLKPVVLLPAVALSGLTPTQLEALLAHELAHVRRHDYLVNLLQSAVETLLFYHPAVWWVSKQVRAEREHCCDDLVVGVCDRVIYVSALTELAAMSVPRPALAATDGSLLTRVRRILGRTDAGATTGGGWISVFVALFVVGAITPMATANVSQAGQGGAVIKEAAGQGVAGGVHGGVTSGVSGGVTGGVSGGVPGSVAVIYEQGTASAEQARQRELEAAARLQAAEAQLHSVNQERSGLDRMKIEEAMKQQRLALEVELKALRQEHSRSKRLVDVGLLNADALAAIEQRMHQAELKLAGVHSELDIKMFELAMRDRDMKARYALELRKAEYDLARSATEARDAIGGQDARKAAEARSRLAQLQRQMEELRRAIEEMDKTERPREREVEEARRAAGDAQRYVEALRETRMADEARRTTATAQSRDSRLLQETKPLTGSNETIRAGDVLSVDIKGEPDLPRAYAVQSNGTIRLPLIGSIKVAGLTAQQAGQAIAKQIARVNSSAAVHVSLRRGGSEQRRER